MRRRTGRRCPFHEHDTIAAHLSQRECTANGPQVARCLTGERCVRCIRDERSLEKNLITPTLSFLTIGTHSSAPGN